MLHGHEQEAYGTCNCKWRSQDFPVGPQPKEKRVMTYYYRPQQVIFFTGVCQSLCSQGGVTCNGQTPPGQTPTPGQTPPE